MKKDISNVKNAASRFISTEKSALENTVQSSSEGKRGQNQQGRPKSQNETKKIKTYTVRQSIYDDAMKIAYIERITISKLLSDFLEKYVEENQDKIKEYDKLSN